MSQEPEHAGILLRQWRQRRKLSQLALASEAEVSQRHLSYVESGRSRPSSAMVVRLSEQLGVPLRERNAILTAAGHAPHYPHHRPDAAELADLRRTVESVVQGHLPHPALAVDRHWTLVCANPAAQALMATVAPHLLEGDINVLRLSLHPEGLAPRILNLPEWRSHLLARLDREFAQSADGKLAALRDELAAYPQPAGSAPVPSTYSAAGRIAVPLMLQGDAGPLAFLSTTTVFGTALDVILSEVTIEAFFPADEHTARAMSGIAADK